MPQRHDTVIDLDSLAMPLCDFDFICGKSWTDLEPTAIRKARHCNECNKHVFLVDGRDEMVVASVLGRCAAERETPFGEMTVGGLVAYHTTHVSLFISLRLPLSEDRVTALRLAFPAIFDAAGNESNLLSGGVVPLALNSLTQISTLEHELEQLAPELDMTVVSPRYDNERTVTFDSPDSPPDEPDQRDLFE